MRCEICDTEIPAGAKECPHCGFEVEWMRGEAKPDNLPQMKQNREQISGPAGQRRRTQSIDRREDDKGKKMKKISLLLLLAIAVVAAAAAAIGVYILIGTLHVGNVAVSKWMLVDESSSTDHYTGIVTSDEKKPFAAVIGGGSGDGLYLVFMDDGQGTIEMSVPSDEDPSLAWELEGYMDGEAIGQKDFEEITYYGSDYFDWDLGSLDSAYRSYTTCIVEVDAVMKKSATGILIYDVEDNANQTVDCNHAMAIVDGAGHSVYIAENLPYKSRGMEDITIIPRFFCAAEKLDQSFTSAEESFIMDKKKTNYTALTNAIEYSGRVSLVLPDYSDGFIIYTSTQVAGGEPEERNTPLNRYTRILPGGRFSIETNNSYDVDSEVAEPEYEFHIAGYAAWRKIEE